MARTVRAYCITAESVARERERVGGNPKDMDVSKVVELDKLELRDVGPRDVHMRILAASAEDPPHDELRQREPRAYHRHRQEHEELDRTVEHDGGCLRPHRPDAPRQALHQEQSRKRQEDMDLRISGWRSR